MSGTYKATGINLKSVPMGESDRLLTILTREHGLIRAIAPGSRKPKSSLRGRSNLFVVNELLIARGRSLDKMIQAESVESFVGISCDLRKLTAGQYLAELVLCQALTDHPQPDLFALVWEHLMRIEQRTASQTLLSLVQATYHLLACGGFTPQVFQCCLTQQAIVPDQSHPKWTAYFDASSGGMIAPAADSAQQNVSQQDMSQPMESQPSQTAAAFSPSNERSGTPYGRSTNHRRIRVLEGRTSYQASHMSNTALGDNTSGHDLAKGPSVQGDGATYSSFSTPLRSQSAQHNARPSAGRIRLTAKEVLVLQSLAQPDILNNSDEVELETLLSIERVLRHYAQYHFERTIRSAELIETCFSSGST